MICKLYDVYYYNMHQHTTGINHKLLASISGSFSMLKHLLYVYYIILQAISGYNVVEWKTAYQLC